jgi:FtsH-binding integral membrane protein
MYEHRKQKVLPRREFVRRVFRHLTGALIAIAIALGIGIVGYHVLAGLGWIDALLNAAMILGGMGPIDPLPNDAAKLFAAAYALFSGLVFIAILGVLLAPFVHRLLHRLHAE